METHNNLKQKYDWKKKQFTITILLLLYRMEVAVKESTERVSKNQQWPTFFIISKYRVVNINDSHKLKKNVLQSKINVSIHSWG